MIKLGPRGWLALLVSAALLYTAPTFAQDFDFDSGGGDEEGGDEGGGDFDFDSGGGDESGGGDFDFDGGGGSSGGRTEYVVDESSPTFAYMQDARRFTEQQDHYKASLLYYKVLQADDDTAMALQPEAYYQLGVTLYQLNLPQSALNQFKRVVNDGPTNPYFKQTLQWLVLIARDLPGQTQLVNTIFDNYKDFFPTEVDPAFLSEMALLMGQAAYNQELLDEAIFNLSYVSRDSEFFPKAKFLEGITFVRKNDGKMALEAFKDILRYTDSHAEPDGTLDPQLAKFRQLAVLSIARVFYSVGSTLYNMGEREKAISSWNNAIKYYATFSRSSPHWLDTLFEASWTYYRTEIFNKALGLLHTLNSPFFSEEYYPEAMLLQSYIYYTTCHYDRAQQIIDNFKAEYRPLKDKLDDQLTQFIDPVDAYKFLSDIYTGRVEFDPTLRKVLSAALQDKQVAQALRFLDVLEEELERIDSSDPGWAQSDLAINLMQEIEFTKKEAQVEAGRIAKSRLERVKDEISALVQKALLTEVEITGKLAEMIELQETDPNARTAFEQQIGQLMSDDEHLFWNFDGEYWRDELGYYWFFISARCGR